MKKSRKRRCERGTVIVESMMAICVMMLVFFALVQIYDWCMAKLFTQYASFYGIKSASLGYKVNFAMRAVRIAAIPISGRIGRPTAREELARAKSYMVYGDASGVAYPYWHPATDQSPCLEARSKDIPEKNSFLCEITMRNMPLIGTSYSQQQLDSSSSGDWNINFAKVFGISENPEPSAETYGYYIYKNYLGAGNADAE